MSNLLKINELWKQLSEVERVAFVSSKIEYSENITVSLESITGSENLKMHLGSVNICPRCGK